MRPVPERLLPGGLRVVAPFEHIATARELMHLLKYRGVSYIAGLAAEILVTRIPELPLAPIPRVLSRRLRYGVDPAFLIAKEISARTGQPVIKALSAPLHARRRAGGDHHRSAPTLHVRSRPPFQVILVDDVVTTGATILAAAGALGRETVALAVAANAASKVTSLPTTH